MTTIASSPLIRTDPGLRQPTTTGPRTRAVRAGITTDSAHGAVIPPLYLSVSYAFDGLGGRGRYDYSRSGNPTRDLFAAAVADLEGGTTGCITGSGMGAITATVNALVPAGRHPACPGGLLRRLLAAVRRPPAHRTAHAPAGRHQ